MKFGVVFPQTERSQDPAALPAIATAVERLGFEIATPQEARERLNLKGGDRVGF